MTKAMRILTNAERSAIEALAGKFRSDEERDQLLSDLNNCTVHDTTSDGSLIAFEISGYQRPPGHKQRAYSGKDGFPVEGKLTDKDGAEISTYLYADAHGRIFEFELDRHGVGSLIGPDWTTFTVR
jgi:hypothetical protein